MELFLFSLYLPVGVDRDIITCPVRRFCLSILPAMFFILCHSDSSKDSEHKGMLTHTGRSVLSVGSVRECCHLNRQLMNLVRS